MTARRRTGGNNTPSFRTQRKKSPIHEFPPPHKVQAALVNASNSYLRTYLMNECSITVTREFGEWHLSIAHRTRYPTWLEISEAWYRTIPDAGRITGAIVLPPLDEYINIHEFCMQVVQIPNREDTPQP